ncbi:MAG: serine hydrolase [Anaerolineaceae bacterium]|nr:serine hydrolase [Anaerolineaceae bacterium]MBN2677921.1 serine hydrolase [Anaerolineaceae bacterium]
MKRKSQFSIIRWVSLFLIVLAVILIMVSLVRYSRVRSSYPAGMMIANVPVGGLTTPEATDRLLQVYASALELRSGEIVIQVKPSSLGFELDFQNMMAAADLARVAQPFWQGYWDNLWGRTRNTVDVPLRYVLDEDSMRQYLMNEIAARFDQPAAAPVPIPGQTSFPEGQPGLTLDIDRSVTDISSALTSATNRVVFLVYEQDEASRPTLQNLEILLKQNIHLSEYDGLIELYMKDLQTNQVIHFAYQALEAASVNPNLPFSALSTLKIPVMVSAYRRLSEDVSPDVMTLMAQMIDKSDNDSTDLLAMTVLDKNTAPIMVSEDMKSLGLVNTFWAGYFYPGAALLRIYETPANQRIDVVTDPEIYDQTTPADLGMLLEDIYQCAQTGGGALVAVFPGEINQSECQQMVSLLAANRIGVLIEAGVPSDAQVAHKHGWATDVEDGYIHTMADAGLVYTPGGDYVLVLFLYDPVQVVFDDANLMIAQLSQAIYNYFNGSAR